MTSIPTVTPERCYCEQAAWGSEADAAQVVVGAKISRELHRNGRRREQRYYRCPTNPNLWHVTAQDSRGGGMPLPEYSVHDDGDAKVFVGRAVPRGDAVVWAALLAPERAAQTLRVLIRIQQELQASSSERRTAMDAVVSRRRAELISHADYAELRDAHADWLRRVEKFRNSTLQRLREARAAVKAHNVAATARENAARRTGERVALRRLALAVKRHREDTPDPTPADRQLWAWLGLLTVPAAEDGATVPLQHMLDEGMWRGEPDDTPGAAS